MLDSRFAGEGGVSASARVSRGVGPHFSARSGAPAVGFARLGGAERGRGGARAGLCGNLLSRPRFSAPRVECGIREGRVGVRVLEGVTVRWMGKNCVWRLFRGQAAMKALRGWRALSPEYDWRLRSGGFPGPRPRFRQHCSPRLRGSPRGWSVGDGLG